MQTQDIYLVKKEMGHASVTTTEMYADFKISRLAQDFPSLKDKIKNHQNRTELPIMVTDSMETGDFQLTT